MIASRRVLLALTIATAVSVPSWGQTPLDFELLISTESLTPGTLGSVSVVGSDGAFRGSLANDLNTPRGTALAASGDFFVSVTGGLGSAGGVVVRIAASGGLDPFVSDVTPGDAVSNPISPFDLEIDPASGDLFISSGPVGILRVPLSGPNAGVPQQGPNSSTPGVFVDRFVLPGGGDPGRALGTTGLGFGPTGELFAGLQPTNSAIPDTAGLLRIDLATGVATQVGVLDNPFDVQVDSLGNVFANNIVPGATVGDSDGEIAFFPGLGAPGVPFPGSPLPSATFSPTAIRGLAIGPVGSTLEDAVFASTAGLQIVQFDPFDASTFDPTFAGNVFADLGAVGLNPFAFDIRFVVPEPGSIAVLGAALVALPAWTRGRRR